MSELAADEVKTHITRVPTSRFNRSVPYRYGQNLFYSHPDLPEVPETNDDQFYTLRFGDQFRPDIVAYRFYGDVNLWWFVILVNEKELKADGTLNFLERFLPGTTLRIPPQQVAFSYINNRR